MRAASSRPGSWRRSRTGAGRAGAAPGSSSTRRTPPARSTASTPPAESRAPPRRSIRPAARRRTCRPCFLPDGKHFLYFVRSDQAGVTGIHAGSLDGSLKKQVLALDVAAVFAPPGFLLYVRDRKLVAHAFDVDRLEVTGEPAILATGLDYLTQYELPPLTASGGGRLIYRSSSEAQLRQLVRFDRKGRRLGTVGEPGDFNIDLSPDGSRLAVGSVRPGEGTSLRSGSTTSRAM